MASSPQIGSTPGDGAGVVGSPRISGLAVWEGGDALTQGEVRERLGLESDDFAGRVFRGAAIKERHLSLHSATLDMSMQARLRRGQERMFEYAVDVVDQLRIDPAEIGAVVSAGMYSLAVPSLAHQLVDRYGMEPTVPAYNLTAVGCASAVPLLRLMTRLLDPESGKKVIVGIKRRHPGSSRYLERKIPRSRRSAIFYQSLHHEAAAVDGAVPRSRCRIIARSVIDYDHGAHVGLGERRHDRTLYRFRSVPRGNQHVNGRLG